MNGTETYTLTATEGTGTTTATLGTTSGGLVVDNIYNPSTTFTFANSGTYHNTQNYALISDFKIILARQEFSVKLNQVNPGTPNEPSYATLYSDHDLQQTDETTKAYYITTVEGGKAKLTKTPNEGRDIPKETAVVLINSEGNTYTAFNIVSGLEQITDIEANKLKGTLTGKTIDLSDASKLYSLGRRRADESSPWVVGFYKTGNATFSLGANRAYLDLTGVPASASGYVFSFDDDGSTSIVEIRNDNDEWSMNGQRSMVNGQWYTLDGRKLNGMPTHKGLYIYNGIKIVIK